MEDSLFLTGEFPIPEDIQQKLHINTINNFDPQTADTHFFMEKAPTDARSRVRLITDQPFSMYYKIASHNKVTHIIVYPGEIRCFEGRNDFFVHQHNHFELLYVLKGEVTNKIDNVSYKYRQGDACLLNRNISHADIPGPDSAVVFINFLGDYALAFLDNETQFDLSGSQHPDVICSQRSIHDFLCSNIRGEQQFCQSYMEFTLTLQALSTSRASSAEILIDRIQQELVTNAPGGGYIISGLLCRLIHLFENSNVYHANVMQLDLSNEEFLFSRINNYLKESHGRISRNELSKALHYNAEYLNQIVKRRSKKTLGQLGKDYMLDYAKDLLGKTDMNIAQIIQQLGFTSSSHFYTFFRKQTGVSPAQFRTAMHKV